MVEITSYFESCGRNLGNKLFTYAVSKIVAQRLGYELRIPYPSYVQRNHIVQEFPFGNIPGTSIEDPVYTITDYDVVDIGLDAIIENARGKKLFVEAYFIKYEYIKPYKQEIKEWYKCLYDKNDGKNDVVVMLRNSNLDHTYKLPDSYYLDILDKISFDTLYVSYDHIENHTPLFKAIEKYNPVLLDMKILDLFKFCTTKNTIIASQGTFSFWASLLSEASTVYWPITKIGPNALTDPNVNLKIDDEDRYVFVEVDNTDL